MNFSNLCKYFQDLEETSSVTQMVQQLAALFAEADLAETPLIAYLSLGRLKPMYESLEFGLAEKMLYKVLIATYGVGEGKVEALFEERGDLGLVAMELATDLGVGDKGKSVTQVYEKLVEIALEAGRGSQERKIAKLKQLLESVRPESAKYIVRIVLGNMRLGFAEKTLIEALSWLGAGDKSLKQEIEEKYFIYPDIGRIAQKFKEDGIAGIKDISIRAGVPVQPALCQRGKTAEEIIERMGGKAVAEYKLDGTRVQLHLDRSQEVEERGQVMFELADIEKPKFLVKTFTRNLEETTYMFPEIIKTVGDLELESVILDGEAIAYDPNTGEFLPFQQTMKRKRKYKVSEKAAELPLRFFAFDILFLNGKNYMEQPLISRRKLLESVLEENDTLVITPQEIVTSARDLAQLREQAVERGLEGLVVKHLDSKYEAGSRGYTWLKYKREQRGKLEDTIDVVVLGYYRGRGRRSELGIGAFLVGVYNAGKDRIESIAKIGTGLSDKEWREMKDICDENSLREKPRNAVLSKKVIPDIWTAPEVFVEVQADEITRSPVHTAGSQGEDAGYALRFPRFVRWREDKSLSNITTVQEIRELYKLQYS
ncbi:MAG: ATP-dependent DNA ligase [Patescibacteria group bacterium]|nr:ATP-dependent DNA ligase [Patescibacteria group bacterium]